MIQIKFKIWISVDVAYKIVPYAITIHVVISTIKHPALHHYYILLVFITFIPTCIESTTF